MKELQEAISAIGAKYKEGMTSWLAETNPLAMRQLDAMADKVDAVILSGANPKSVIMAWRNTWLFWIKARGK